MPNSRQARKQAQQYAQLTNTQIEHLARSVCSCGDDAYSKSRTLLLLMDEIQRRPTQAANISLISKNVAFARLMEEDSDAVDAQIQLLRSELPGSHE
ncbi:MAG: hypothetical protein ACR2HX_19470 [Pyrinomonadaceae bacterium]